LQRLDLSRGRDLVAHGVGARHCDSTGMPVTAASPALVPTCLVHAAAATVATRPTYHVRLFTAS
jgi:hypothetical protein